MTSYTLKFTRKADKDESDIYKNMLRINLEKYMPNSFVGI